jgi:hypothetical protein
VVSCASSLGRERGFRQKKKTSANSHKKRKTPQKKKKKSPVSSGQIFTTDDAHEKEKSIRAPLQSPRHKRRARARSIDACARTNARKERGRERRKKRERDLQEWVTRCAFIYTLFSFFFFFARCGSFFFCQLSSFSSLFVIERREKRDTSKSRARGLFAPAFLPAAPAFFFSFFLVSPLVFSVLCLSRC